MIQAAQAVLLQLPFPNGKEGIYPRPYIILEVSNHVILALTTRSIEGKEERYYPSDIVVEQYNPPLQRESVVQLYAIYEIENFVGIEFALLAKGQKLQEESFHKICAAFEDYKKNHDIIVVRLSKQNLLSRNARLNQQVLKFEASFEALKSESQQEVDEEFNSYSRVSKDDDMVR